MCGANTSEGSLLPIWRLVCLERMNRLSVASEESVSGAFAENGQQTQGAQAAIGKKEQRIKRLT